MIIESTHIRFKSLLTGGFLYCFMPIISVMGYP